MRSDQEGGKVSQRPLSLSTTMSGRHNRGSFRRGRHSFSSGRDRPPGDNTDNQDQTHSNTSTTPQSPHSYNYPSSTYTGPSQSASQITYAYPPRPDPSLPPGKADLQTLETLKAIIKDNQHQHFRPVPNPQALASIYAGPLPPDLLQNIGQNQSTSPAPSDRQRPDSRSRGPNPPPSATSSNNVCFPSADCG